MISLVQNLTYEQKLVYGPLKTGVYEQILTKYIKLFMACQLLVSTCFFNIAITIKQEVTL